MVYKKGSAWRMKGKKAEIEFTALVALFLVIVLAALAYNLSKTASEFDGSIGNRQIALLQAQSKVSKIGDYLDRSVKYAAEYSVSSIFRNGPDSCPKYAGMPLVSDPKCDYSSDSVSAEFSSDFNEIMDAYIESMPFGSVPKSNYEPVLLVKKDSITVLANAKEKASVEIISEKEDPKTWTFKEKEVSVNFDKLKSSVSFGLPSGSGSSSGTGSSGSTAVSGVVQYDIWPLGKDTKNLITCGFGLRVSSGSQNHPGIDIDDTPTVDGSTTPVYAVADGKVILVSIKPNPYDSYLRISHTTDKFVSEYIHVDKITVKQDQAVKKGDVIGHITKQNNSHLHFGLIPKEAKASTAPSIGDVCKSDDKSKACPVIYGVNSHNYYVNPACFIKKDLISSAEQSSTVCSICGQCSGFDIYDSCDKYTGVMFS